MKCVFFWNALLCHLSRTKRNYFQYQASATVLNIKVIKLNAAGLFSYWRTVNFDSVITTMRDETVEIFNFLNTEIEDFKNLGLLSNHVEQWGFSTLQATFVQFGVPTKNEGSIGSGRLKNQTWAHSKSLNLTKILSRRTNLNSDLNNHQLRMWTIKCEKKNYNLLFPNSKWPWRESSHSLQTRSMTLLWDYDTEKPYQIFTQNLSSRYKFSTFELPLILLE